MPIDDTKEFTIDVLPAKIRNSRGNEWDPTGDNYILAFNDAKNNPPTIPCPKDGILHPWVHIPTCDILIVLPYVVGTSGNKWMAPCNNMHIFGNGPGKTILRTDEENAGYNHSIFWVENINGVEIENFTYDSNYKGKYNNIIFRTVNNSKLHNIDILHCRYNAIALGAGSSNLRSTYLIVHDINVRDGLLDGTGMHGFGINAQYSIFKNLHVENHESGIDVWGADNTFENISIMNTKTLGMKVVIGGSGAYPPINNTFLGISIILNPEVTAQCLRIEDVGSHYENVYTSGGGNAVTAVSSAYGGGALNCTFENIEIHDNHSSAFVLGGIGGHHANNIRIYHAGYPLPSEVGGPGFSINSPDCEITNLLVDGFYRANRMNANNARLLHAMIKNGTYEQALMLGWGSTDGVMVDDVTIINNSNNGIDTRSTGSSTHYTIQNCNIRNNNNGIYLGSTDNYITIINNVICNNRGQNLIDTTPAGTIKDIRDNIFVC
jgi:hypothetical protein